MLLSKSKYKLRKTIERLVPFMWFRRKSYSQDGEDLVLKSIMNCKKGYKGFYVDIGAHHPYRFSNTAIFYSEGWRGINIEPTPSLIPEFNRRRKNDITLNLGVSKMEQNMLFYEFNEPALNNFDKALSKERNGSTNYFITNEIEIQTKTLGNILQEHITPSQTIDFFTIDVEGFDFNVLQSNNWDKFKPHYILVECHTDFKNIQEDEIYQFLIGLEYELIAKTKRTYIFCDLHFK